MKLILKKSPPPSFQVYQKAFNASFDEMDKEKKDALRLSLLKEQYWVCAYCQQKLKSASSVKIEHHCEQSICNGKDGTSDRRLDYTNLFAVCLGEGGNPKIEHCDTHKSKFSSSNGLPITVNPTILAHINSIEYKQTGLIKSSVEKYNQELSHILNLNTLHLKDARKRKWNLIFKASLDKTGKRNKEKMKRLLDKSLEKISEGKYENSFPGLSEYMLRKFC